MMLRLPMWLVAEVLGEFSIGRMKQMMVSAYWCCLKLLLKAPIA